MGKEKGSFMENFLDNHFPWRRINKEFDFSQCYLYDSKKQPSGYWVKDNRGRIDDQKSLFEGLVRRFNKFASELEEFANLKKITGDLEQGIDKERFAILQEYLTSLCMNDPNMLLVSKRRNEEILGICDYAIEAGATDFLKRVLDYNNLPVTSEYAIRHCDNYGNTVPMRVLCSDLDEKEDIVIKSLGYRNGRGFSNDKGNRIGQIAVIKKCFKLAKECLKYPEISMHSNNSGDNMGHFLAYAYGYNLNEDERVALDECFKLASQNEGIVSCKSKGCGNKTMLDLAEKNGYKLDEEMIATRKELERKEEQRKLDAYKDYLGVC